MPAFSNSPWSTYQKESSATADVVLRWCEKINSFVGQTRLWGEEAKIEVELDKDEVLEKSFVYDRHTVYFTFQPDWVTTEKVAQLKGKNTHRINGWCIIHDNSSFVDFYSMESEENIRLTVEEFGSHRFYYSHYDASDEKGKEKFKQCCEDCFNFG